jgi:hypothetical protein
VNLPHWFLEDEHKHSTPMLPTTKEDVIAQKIELKAINSQSTKKVAEAQARKKKRVCCLFVWVFVFYVSDSMSFIVNCAQHLAGREDGEDEDEGSQYQRLRHPRAAEDQGDSEALQGLPQEPGQAQQGLRRRYQ